MEHGLDRPGSGQGHVVVSCGCGNESLSPIKRGKFLDYLRTCHVLKVDSAPRSSVHVLRFMSIPFAVREA